MHEWMAGWIKDMQASKQTNRRTDRQWWTDVHLGELVAGRMDVLDE